MKRMQRTLSVLLAAVLALTGLVGLGMTADAAYKVGDVIPFGAYPQSKVTDNSLINTLNAQNAEWKSYGYYSGTGSYCDGKMAASDYMQYCDVTVDGARYRGVQFSQFRPEWTGYLCSAVYSDQDDNGYYQNEIYWFRYEPLQWRVLDPTDGLVMCSTIIDAQPFHNYVLEYGSDGCEGIAYWGDSDKTFFANNYAKSDIRAWLNDTFFKAAFSDAQQAAIKETTMTNRCKPSLDGYTNYTVYDAPKTTDKVFLLSYDGATNPAYGFISNGNLTDPARRLKGSDYAKSQGLYVEKDLAAYKGYSSIALRTANTAVGICSISVNGQVHNSTGAPYTSGGICPVIRVNLDQIASALKIAQLPNKTTYTYRVDTDLDLTGLKLEATCLDGTTKTVTNLSDCTVTGYSAKPVGVKTVTVAYGGQSVQFDVTVRYVWWQQLIRIFLLGILWY